MSDYLEPQQGAYQHKVLPATHGSFFSLPVRLHLQQKEYFCNSDLCEHQQAILSCIACLVNTTWTYICYFGTDIGARATTLKYTDSETAAQGMALCEKGNFSYKQDNENYVVIDQHLTARVARLINNVARLYLVDSTTVQQPIPQHITLTDETGANVPPFLNSFLITWTSTYTLWVHGHEHLVLNNQKQHSIRGIAEAASGIV